MAESVFYRTARADMILPAVTWGEKGGPISSRYSEVIVLRPTCQRGEFGESEEWAAQVTDSRSRSIADRILA